MREGRMASRFEWQQHTEPPRIKALTSEVMGNEACVYWDHLNVRLRKQQGPPAPRVMYAPLTFICCLSIMSECRYVTVNKLEAIYFLARAGV